MVDDDPARAEEEEEEEEEDKAKKEDALKVKEMMKTELEEAVNFAV